MSDKPRHPLLALEDWWTVWFGMAIIAVATVLGLLAYSGTMGKLSVPKIGKWVSNPADAFYLAKKHRLEFDEPVTLAQFADAINAKKPEARAEVVPADDGVKLRIVTQRGGAGQTISVSSVLAGGAIAWSKIDPDPAGLGARIYETQVFPDEDAVLGSGNATLTENRTGGLLPALLISFALVCLLTTVGVKVMGENAGRYAVGFLIVFVIAVLSYVLAHQKTIDAYGLGYAFWALTIGLLISNTIGTPSLLMPGVRTEMYIKTGLVLLGAEILFGKILALGPPGLMVAWIVTPVVIVFMYIFGVRVLKMSSKALIIIIAAATSVCGVSAAIAAAGASRAKKEELTLAVGMTLIFTVAMMIGMPIFIKWVGMSDVVGAAWMGGTIDSTGAVVAAGAFLGPKAETVAAVVKMVQNVLIGVVAFFIAVYWCMVVDRDACETKPNAMEIWHRFPKFIVGFVAASILFSFVLSPIFGSLFSGDGITLVEKGVIKPISNPLRGWFFCLAFVSIGLESNFRDLASQLVGGKPIILYIVGQSFNLLLTLFLAWMAFDILFPNVI